MASFVTSGFDTTPETLNGLETGVILPDGSLIVTTDGHAITTFGQNELFILGTVIATGDADEAIHVDRSGPYVNANSLRLQIGAGATVMASGATTIRADLALFLVLSNLGHVSGPNTAIELRQGGNGLAAHITNAGTMEALGDTLVLGLGSGGLMLANSGSILSSYGRAISLGGHGEAMIVNSGIIATTLGALAIEGSGIGLGSSIRNTGEIHGGLLLTPGTDTVRNTGLITGDVGTYLGDDLVANRGHIEGSVALFDGDDTFDGRGGTIGGTVAGGRGSDTYILDSATEIVENASSGSDRVHSSVRIVLAAYVETLVQTGAADIRGYGNAISNTIHGNAGDNLLAGFDGNDRISGGYGDDDIRGGSGTDSYDASGAANSVTIDLAARSASGFDIGTDRLNSVENATGGAGGDTIAGSTGANTLAGGAGNDTLSGGEGADRIIGGTGRDTATGGAGADMFRFETAEVAGDRITDFAPGTDLIDVSAIDAVAGGADNAFTFIGSAAFTATAGTLRVAQDAALGITLLQGNTDSDTTPEFEVTLAGLLALSAASLVL